MSASLNREDTRTGPWSIAVGLLMTTRKADGTTATWPRRNPRRLRDGAADTLLVDKDRGLGGGVGRLGACLTILRRPDAVIAE
jgi:hypothetical protein